jgi:hypothetical protein
MAMSTRKVTAKVRLEQPDDVGVRWEDRSGSGPQALEGRTGLPGPLSRVTWFERAYFLAVGALAAAVGLPTYFSPANAADVLPFAVPPLHARLIGAMYLSGLALMLGATFARRWADVRVVPAITAIWTGGLLLVTLLHLEAFDFATTQTLIWFGAYAAYPLIGILLIVRRRQVRDVGAADRRLSAAGRRWLMGEGVLLSALGAALLVAPGTMAQGWPWPVTPLLAQIYSAPLLAYGIGTVLLSRVRTWRETRIGVVGIGLFALLALIGSVIHRDLFAIGDPAAWAWFALLAAVTAGALAMMFASRSSR